MLLLVVLLSIASLVESQARMTEAEIHARFGKPPGEGGDEVPDLRHLNTEDTPDEDEFGLEKTKRTFKERNRRLNFIKEHYKVVQANATGLGSLPKVRHLSCSNQWALWPQHFCLLTATLALHLRARWIRSGRRQRYQRTRSCMHSMALHCARLALRCLTTCPPFSLLPLA